MYSIPGVNCLFVNEYLLLFFYVDDIAILYSAQYHEHFKRFESALLQRFEMRTLRELKCSLIYVLKEIDLLASYDYVMIRTPRR